MRILLISDHRDDQILFSEVVKTLSPKIDCEVIHPAEGSRINERAELAQFIFVDVTAPHKDLPKTLESIAMKTRLEDIEVIIFSSLESEQDIQCVKSLKSTVVAKPSTFAGILNTVSHVIEEAARYRKSIEAFRAILVNNH